MRMILSSSLQLIDNDDIQRKCRIVIVDFHIVVECRNRLTTFDFEYINFFLLISHSFVQFVENIIDQLVKLIENSTR